MRYESAQLFADSVFAQHRNHCGGQKSGPERKNAADPKGFALKLTIAAAVIDVAANVAMLLALRAAMLSTTSVLMSLYPAVTVVLAIVVVRERVTRWQALGMVAALVAIALISLH